MDFFTISRTTWLGSEMDLGLAGARALVLGSTRARSRRRGGPDRRGRGGRGRQDVTGPHRRDGGRDRRHRLGARRPLRGARRCAAGRPRPSSSSAGWTSASSTPAGHAGADHVDRRCRRRGVRSMLRPALEVAAPRPRTSASAGGALARSSRRGRWWRPARTWRCQSVMRSGVAAAARSLALELAPARLGERRGHRPVRHAGARAFRSCQGRHEQRSRRRGRAARTRRVDPARVAWGRPGVRRCRRVPARSARSSFVTGSVVRIDGGAVRDSDVRAVPRSDVAAPADASRGRAR